jgi:hypothetical protein
MREAVEQAAINNTKAAMQKSTLRFFMPEFFR